MEKTERWLKANFYVLLLILGIYLLMPFFWTGWANSHTEEDAYYYFSIARNLAQGKGITYAGEWTNGFQPLWVFLLSPVFLFKTSLILPVKIALVLGGIFFLLSGFLVLASGLLLFQDKALALFSSLLWLTSVFALEQAVNGMETGLYYFCLSALLYIYLKRIRLNPAPGIRDWISLGALSGVCFLARIDVCLILIPLWSAGLWHNYKQSWMQGTQPSKIPRNVFWGFLFFLVFALPWVFYNLWLWGNPLPVSAVFASVQFWQAMTFRWRAVMTLKTLLRLPLFYPLSFYTYFRHNSQMNLILLCLGALFWTSAFLRDRNLRSSTLKLPLFSTLFASALLALGYLLPTTAHWFIPRYLSPMILLLIFYFASSWYHYLARKPALLGVLCSILIATCFLIDLFGAFYKNNFPQYYMNLYRLQNLKWIQKNLPKNQPLGSFQSGIYYYYLSPEGYLVYNLDGKMSISAYRALKGNYLDQVLKEKGIVYLIDWRQYLSPFFKNYQMLPERDYQIITKLGSDYLAKLLYNTKR